MAPALDNERRREKGLAKLVLMCTLTKAYCPHHHEDADYHYRRLYHFLSLSVFRKNNVNDNHNCHHRFFSLSNS